MNEHQLFMRQALDLALKSAKQGTGPFGCVIVKNGKVIAQGHNEVTRCNDPSAHAEIQTIRKACAKLKHFQLTDCDLYTSAYPCPMCLGAIYWARPRQVYYLNTARQAAAIGFDDQFIYEELAKPGSKRYYPLKRIKIDHDLAAFNYWKNLENKTEY